MSRAGTTLDLGLPNTDAQEAAYQAAHARPSLLAGAGAAINTQWAGSWAGRQIAGLTFSEDPDFHLTRENEAVLTAGLPEQFWDFSDAVSMDHAMAIRQQRLEQVRNLDTLGRMGWTGTALSIGAAMLDPVDIAVGAGVTALTGGTGLAPWIAGKAGRLRRLAGAGLVGAASAVPVQAYISSQDPVQDEMDVLYAALGGAVGGAGLDALGQKWASVLGNARRNIEGMDTIRYAMGAAGPGEFESLLKNLKTDRGRVYFRGTVADDDKAQIAERLLRGLGLGEGDEEIVADLRKVIEADPEDFLSRLRTGPTGLLLEQPGAPSSISEVVESATGEGATTNTRPLLATDYRLDALPTDDPILRGAVRPSYVGIFGRSKGELLRRWGLGALGDPLPRRNGPAPLGALEWVLARSRAEQGRFLREYDEGYNLWRRESGKRNTLRTRREFNETVGRLVRSTASDADVPAHYRGAVAAVRKSLKDTLAMTQRHGTPGMDDVESFSQYLPRLWSARAMQTAIELHGTQAVDDLIAAAFRQAHPDLEDVDAIAAKVGRGMRRTILDASNRTDFDRARGMSGLDPDAMESILKDAGVTDPDLVADIMYGVNRLKPEPSEAGVTPRGRARVLLDETAAISTGPGPLRMEDLLENDAEMIVGKYVRQMYGAAANARLYDAVGQQTGRTIRTQDDLLRAIQDDLAEAGVPIERQLLRESRDSSVEYARQIDNVIRGVPLVRDQGLARLLRRSRQYQHLRVGGSFVFASIPETAQIMIETGLTAALRGMPPLRALLDEFRTGKVSNEFVAEIEYNLGQGLDGYTHRIALHADDGDSASALSGIGRKFDTAVDQLNHLTNRATLISPLTRFQQLWSAGAALQKWAAIARTNRIPSATRLRAMNVTEEQARRIVAAMRDEMDGGGVEQVNGALFGRKVTRLNFDRWKDQDAASLLLGSVSRWSRRVIQTGDIATMVPWMANNSWGRTLMQFRSFGVQAWERQFLHSTTTPDATTVARVLVTGMAGTLVWTGQTYVRSLGESDPEAFRAERLTPKNFAAAAFSRGGWSSLLPGFVDSALAAGGVDDAVFDFRNSGLSSQLLDANSSPTVQFVNQMKTSANAAFGPMWREDDPFSQRDAEAVFSLLPWNRVMGVREMFRNAIQNLPETDQEAR